MGRETQGSVMTEKNKSKTQDDASLFVTMTAEKQGWEKNPDADLTDILMKGLAKNYNRYGYYSCPCREARGIREEDKDIICPCEYCRPDQKEYGHCYCWLFFTKDFHGSGKIPMYITDRRGSAE